MHMPVSKQAEKRKLKFYVLPRKVVCMMGIQTLKKLGRMISLSLPAVKLNGRELEVRETEAGHLVRR